jgi:hypothetical protein
MVGKEIGLQLRKLTKGDIWDLGVSCNTRRGDLGMRSVMCFLVFPDIFYDKDGN